MMSGISWKSGFLRLWVVLFIVWMAVLFALQRPDKDLRLIYRIDRALEQIADLTYSAGDVAQLADGSLQTRAEVTADKVKLQAAQEKSADRVALFGKLALAPSFGLLAFGMLVAWALKGFDRKQK